MDGRVFVLYPRGDRTGGPEAQHQLVSALRKVGRDAYLVPLPGTEHRPRVPAYDHYGCPEALMADDAVSNVVVVSEVALGELKKYKNASRMIWWLSVDNSPAMRRFLSVTRFENGAADRSLGIVPRGKRLVKELVALKELKDLWGLSRMRITHLTQSVYAWQHVHALTGVVPFMLSDYTVTRDPVEPTPVGRTFIAYNPKKGGVFAEQLSRLRPDLDLLPLEGYSSSAVADLLRQSLIYLDLGHHPGKDRMPREAAVAGAIVVSARRGSAANAFDVPIDERCKVDLHAREDPASVAQRVGELLDAILSDPYAYAESQGSYRAAVAQEYETFLREVSAVFVAPGSGIVT